MFAVVIHQFSIRQCILFQAHLANAFNQSRVVGRVQRTKEALLEVGVSVLGGAITTIGSSIFLLFAQFKFSTIFGVSLFISCSL
jgi:hypothetical protein